VKRFAEGGGHVLGICNGFQILCEARMLPGTLRQNAHLKFNCETRPVRVERTETDFTSDYTKGDVLNLPIAHHEGCYYADDATLAALQANGQIMLRYCDEAGDSTRDDANPNGSAAHIAGIINEAGNVLGMMPHPERACDLHLGSTDGAGMFISLRAKLSA
jgi:phosphoribosylformylglycinamidine synthase